MALVSFICDYISVLDSSLDIRSLLLSLSFASVGCNIIPLSKYLTWAPGMLLHQIKLGFSWEYSCFNYQATVFRNTVKACCTIRMFGLFQTLLSILWICILSLFQQFIFLFYLWPSVSLFFCFSSLITDTPCTTRFKTWISECLQVNLINNLTIFPVQFSSQPFLKCALPYLDISAVSMQSLMWAIMSDISHGSHHNCICPVYIHNNLPLNQQ